MKSTEELKQLRSKNIKDLIADLKKDYDHSRQSYFDKEFRKNKNIKLIHANRKKIARTWTIINEKIENERMQKDSK